LINKLSPLGSRCGVWVRVYLNLCSVSRCDVGDGPARLLPDGFLGATEQVQEAGESGAVQHHLGQRKR